jgi:hypothetical protein
MAISQCRGTAVKGECVALLVVVVVVVVVNAFISCSEMP